MADLLCFCFFFLNELKGLKLYLFNSFNVTLGTYFIRSGKTSIKINNLIIIKSLMLFFPESVWGEIPAGLRLNRQQNVVEIKFLVIL